MADSAQERTADSPTADPTVTPKQDQSATQVLIGMCPSKFDTLVIFAPFIDAYCQTEFVQDLQDPNRPIQSLDR